MSGAMGFSLRYLNVTTCAVVDHGAVYSSPERSEVAGTSYLTVVGCSGASAISADRTENSLESCWFSNNTVHAGDGHALIVTHKTPLVRVVSCRFVHDTSTLFFWTIQKDDTYNIAGCYFSGGAPSFSYLSPSQNYFNTDPPRFAHTYLETGACGTFAPTNLFVPSQTIIATGCAATGGAPATGPFARTAAPFAATARILTTRPFAGTYRLAGTAATFGVTAGDRTVSVDRSVTIEGTGGVVASRAFAGSRGWGAPADSSAENRSSVAGQWWIIAVAVGAVVLIGAGVALAVVRARARAEYYYDDEEDKRSTEFDATASEVTHSLLGPAFENPLNTEDGVGAIEDSIDEMI
jgi:hypothetical protein